MLEGLLTFSRRVDLQDVLMAGLDLLHRAARPDWERQTTQKLVRYLHTLYVHSVLLFLIMSNHSSDQEEGT